MKTEKNILVAFLLNLSFAIFEFFGGLWTGSVAILSDAVHDLGDAASIGLSWLLERKSKRPPDEMHTYGYARYSVLGSLITTMILLVGSVLVICNAIVRIIHPTEIHYDGMIIFAIVGVIVNLIAAFATRDGDSLNQKAVNLHMLEDVLGWVVVLVGGLIIRWTDFTLLDPLLSIGVATFILFHAAKNLWETVSLLLENTPHGLNVGEIRNHLLQLDSITDVHHIHLWSLDGRIHCATMHIIANGTPHEIKAQVRQELQEHGIAHATLELEAVGEHCHDYVCHTEPTLSTGHHHH